MARSESSPSVLIDAVWPAASGKVVRLIALALIGNALLYLSARVQVPFWPVPMTMQTLVVLLIGAAYGWRLAGATVVLYLLEGAAGLPVFSGTPERGIGLAYMTGPTGGFLVGFLFAAMVVGWLAERGWARNWLKIGAAMIVADVLVFAVGVAWLGSYVGLARAYQLGVEPFLLGDVLKIALAVAAVQAGWWGIERRRL